MHFNFVSTHSAKNFVSTQEIKKERKKKTKYSMALVLWKMLIVTNLLHFYMSILEAARFSWNLGAKHAIIRFFFLNFN